MPIKPKKPKSRKLFGTRRNYRRYRGRLFVSTDFKFGIDVGREDATALVVCDYSGAELRILAHYVGNEIRLPANEELLAEFPATRPDPYSDLALAMAYAFEVDKPRKLGKSPALAAPFGKSKDSS